MENKEIIRKYVDAYGASDWKSYEEILDENVSYKDSGGSELHGSQKVISSMKDWKVGFPDASIHKVTSMISEGHMVATEVTWTGTHTETLTSEKRKLTTGKETKATGNVIFHDAVLIMEVRDGKIKDIRHYYDMNDFDRQISAKKGDAA